MASTFLSLVNDVLRDMNEVELTSSNFGTSRGVQTTVKDYINRSIADIINSELNWPFTRKALQMLLLAKLCTATRQLAPL